MHSVSICFSRVEINRKNNFLIFAMLHISYQPEKAPSKSIQL